VADGIDLNGAGIDMFPSATSAAVAALGKAGTDFRTEWLGELGKIAALDSQLGQGPLGRPFARQYIDAMKQIVDGLDELGRRIETRVTFGNNCVRDYVATEQENTRLMRG
jgi:hypothetical protein